MTHDTKLTQDQMEIIEQCSAIRLPMAHIATLVKISHDTLERMYNNPDPQYDTLRASINGGRAKASRGVRGLLYQMAMGRQARYQRDKKGNIVTDKQGKPILLEAAIAPDFQAVKFWCQTQEDFKIAGQFELSGPGGGPIRVSSIDEKDLQAIFGDAETAQESLRVAEKLAEIKARNQETK